MAYVTPKDFFHQVRVFDGWKSETLIDVNSFLTTVESINVHVRTYDSEGGFERMNAVVIYRVLR